MNEDARDFEEDDFEEAVARFRKMVKSDASDYFDVYEVEGIIDYFLEEGRIKMARKAVDTGLLLHPTALSIKIRQAQVFMHEGQLEECLDLLGMAEKIDATNVGNLFDQGRSFKLAG